MIGAGALAGRTKLIDLDGARALSAYVFWIAFPALLLHSLSNSPAPDRGLAVSLAAYGLAASAPLFAILLLGKALGWSREARAGAGMASIGGNTAFLGAPVAVSLFGDAASVPAAAVVAVDCTVIMAIATATVRGAAGQGWRRTAVLTAQNPLVISALVGAAMMFAGLRFAGPLDQALGVLRATASPVGLVALGVVVGLEFGRPARGEAAPVAFAAAFKLLLAPGLVFLALTFAGAEPLTRATATLLAACPTAVNVFIQTRTYGVFARGGAMTVVLATLGAVVSLPLIGGLLEGTIR